MARPTAARVAVGPMTIAPPRPWREREWVVLTARLVRLGNPRFRRAVGVVAVLGALLSPRGVRSRGGAGGAPRRAARTGGLAVRPARPGHRPAPEGAGLGGPARPH